MFDSCAQSYLVCTKVPSFHRHEALPYRSRQPRRGRGGGPVCWHAANDPGLNQIRYLRPVILAGRGGSPDSLSPKATATLWLDVSPKLHLPLMNLRPNPDVVRLLAEAQFDNLLPCFLNPLEPKRP